jgi:hypothetical protein
VESARILAAKAADSVDLDFHTIRPAADQELVRGGPRNNQDRQTHRRKLSEDAMINGPGFYHFSCQGRSPYIFFRSSVALRFRLLIAILA